MQQFLVPQFIDVENKILGPITTRQFVILIVTIGMMFVCYKTLDFAAFLVASLFIVVIAAAFGFVKVNGMQFHFFVLNMLQTVLRPSLRVWAKNVGPLPDEETAKDVMHDVPTKVISASSKLVNASRLSELSMIVNTGGSYKGEE